MADVKCKQIPVIDFVDLSQVEIVSDFHLQFFSAKPSRNYYWLVNHFTLEVFLFVQENQNHLIYLIYRINFINQSNALKIAIIICLYLFCIYEMENDFALWRKNYARKFFHVKFYRKKMWSGNRALEIISREILHSSNLIGFAQFSAKKVENISTFFIFARNTTIENVPIFEISYKLFKVEIRLKAYFPLDEKFVRSGIFSPRHSREEFFFLPHNIHLLWKARYTVAVDVENFDLKSWQYSTCLFSLSYFPPY